MRKKREYRPRPGIRFDRRMPAGVPQAFFVDGPGIDLTDVITGSMMPYVQQTSGNILQVGDFSYQENQLKNTLLGLRQSGLGTGSSAIVATPYTASIPSWTNYKLGRNFSFVTTTLSSSDHESQVLNCFRSGTQPLEVTAVPASATLYYSKQTRMNQVVVKLTASQATGLYDDANFGTLVDSSASVISPLTFKFNVPVTGRLTDVKIWVEICTLSGNVAATSTGSGGHLVWAALDGATTYQSLESFGISLRSPNVSWPGHWAHPIMNDVMYQAQLFSTASDPNFVSAINVKNPPEFYRDSYLLWEPAPLFEFAYTSQTAGGAGYRAPAEPAFGFGASVARMRANFPTWGRDLGMRTVFCDGSPYVNPRVFYNELSPWLAANGAPNVTGSWPNLASAGTLSGTYQQGNNVPWTGDSGSWGNNDGGGLSAYIGGSPPAGWLSGPGGVAAVNEWPTTGSNLGAPTLQPMYPFLDDVYQMYLSDNGKWYAGLLVTPINDPYPGHLQWRGFRPGLYDTEISGTWSLMFCRPASGSTSSGVVNPWMFVRQARLELWYVTGRRPSARNHSRRKGPNKGAAKFWGKISGSDRYHYTDTGPSAIGAFEHVTYQSTQQSPEAYFGFFLGSGSDGTTSAVQWWLSGALSDLSGTAPGWLTNNRFGMPDIPFSSASLYAGPATDVTTIHPQDIISDRPLLAGARLVSDAAVDANPPQKLTSRYATVISGTAI